MTDGAWLCKNCWLKEAPADRVCASCKKGVDAVSRWMKSKRIEDGAWLCMKCWWKEAPADRVCASCKKGVDAVNRWMKSKRIEDAPWLCMKCYSKEVRTSRFLPFLSHERARTTSSAPVRFLTHRATFSFPVLRRPPTS